MYIHYPTLRAPPTQHTNRPGSTRKDEFEQLPRRSRTAAARTHSPATDHTSFPNAAGLLTSVRVDANDATRPCTYSSHLSRSTATATATAAATTATTSVAAASYTAAVCGHGCYWHDGSCCFAQHHDHNDDHHNEEP